MTANSPSALFTSTALHAGVVIAILFLAYGIKRTPPPQPVIFELVAGPGDNFMATVAPAAGDGGPATLAVAPLPEPPAPKAEPEPVQAAPISPAPVAPPQATPAPQKTKTLAETVRWSLIVAESRAKLQLKREREAEAKRAREAEKKRLAEEQKKKVTKEEFDRKQKGKAVATSKTPPPKVKQINTAGIRSGVLGGDPANTVGGAGGKALTAQEGDEAQRYLALLEQRLREKLEEIPGLEDGLKAEAEFQILSDGRLTRGTITQSSRNEAFDTAVLRAIASISMPPRPKGVAQSQQAPFYTQAKN